MFELVDSRGEELVSLPDYLLLLGPLQKPNVARMPPNNDPVTSRSSVLLENVLRVNFQADPGHGDGTETGDCRHQKLVIYPNSWNGVNAFAHIVYVKLSEIKKKK